MKNRTLLLLVASLQLFACASPGIRSTPNADRDIASTANRSDVNENWHCIKNTRGEWHCSEPTHSVPPSVKASKQDREIPAGNKPIKAVVGNSSEDNAANTTKDSDNSAQHTTADSSPDKPLSSYPDNYFAIQLVAAKNQKTIARYRQKNPHLEGKLYNIEIDNQQWELLILAVYSTREEAVKRVANITPAPSVNPWIRPLGRLKKVLISP